VGWVAIIIVALLSSLSGSAGAKPAESDVAVIAHPSCQASSISSSKLSSLFGARTTSWGRCKRVRILNLPNKNPTRVLFDKVVHGMTPRETASYWLARLVRGQGRSPRQISKPAVTVRLVAKVKGAIGYVPATENLEGVVVIAWIRKGKLVAP